MNNEPNNEEPLYMEPDGETPEQGVIIRVTGDEITYKRDGKTYYFRVDRPRIKKMCAELHRRTPGLTEVGMAVYTDRVAELFRMVGTWADVDTRHMAEQIAATLEAYKPGVNFPACKKLLNAAVNRRWNEYLASRGARG